MQIAKFFGALGFKVDTSGLDDFTTAMRTARTQARKFSNETTGLDRNVRVVNTALRNLKKNLNLAFSSASIRGEFKTLNTSIESTAKAFKGIENRKGSLNYTLQSIENRVASGIPKWEAYRKQVEATASVLLGLAGTTTRIHTPRISNQASNIANTGRSGYGDGTFGSRGGAGALFAGGLAGGGLFNTARMAIVGGIATALPFAGGALMKSVIHQGRELRSADQVLLAHSENDSDYGRNRRFIDRLTTETGIGLTESIRGFGRVLSASKAGGGTTNQAMDVFSSFAKYATTMHLGQDEQSRLIKALEQTYTNGRILGGEINQFANVGIPMKAILKELSHGNLGGDSKEKAPEWVQKLAGSKAPNTVQLMPFISKFLLNTAMNNGAYQRAIHSSQAEQGRFQNRYQEFASHIMENGGDEALASFFRLLTVVVDKMLDFHKAILAVNKALNSAFGEGGGSKLSYLLLLFLPLGRILRAVTGGAKGFASVFTRVGASAGRASGGIARTTTFVTRLMPFLKRAIGLLWRFGGRWLWIISVIQAFMAVGQALNDKSNGYITWIDVWTAKLQTVSFWYDYIMEKVKILQNQSLNLVGLGQSEPSFRDPTKVGQESTTMGSLLSGGIFGKATSLTTMGIVNAQNAFSKGRFFEAEPIQKDLTLVNHVYVDGKHIDTNSKRINYGTSNNAQR